MNVGATASGTRLEVGSVTVDGLTQAVPTVTQGAASVTSGAANQPILTVGNSGVTVISGASGQTAGAAVSSTNGSSTTQLTVSGGMTLQVPSGASLSGTTMTIPATPSGGTVQPVTLHLGGQTLTVQPFKGEATLYFTNVGGQPAVLVQNGTLNIAAASPGDTLIGLGSINGATSGAANTQVIVTHGGDKHRVNVVTGILLLPRNTFKALADNGFADSAMSVYPGETAVVDDSGKVIDIYLGSLDRDESKIGDLAPYTSATTPRLDGAPESLKGQKLIDALTASLNKAAGTDLHGAGQNATSGILQLSGQGIVVQALPLGEIRIDDTRPDGIATLPDGRVEVAARGLVAMFAPGVAGYGDLAGLVAGMNGAVALREDGKLSVKIGGDSYVLRPAWTTETVKPAKPTVDNDAQGNLRLTAQDGQRQFLYPAIDDPAALKAAFLSLDANLSIQENTDGTATAKLLGKRYTLQPDYRLGAIPKEHEKDAWWVVGDKVYVKSGDGKMAQGFGIK